MRNKAIIGIIVIVIILVLLIVFSVDGKLFLSPKREISKSVEGDINRDRVVDVNDGILALQMLRGLKVDGDRQAADFNGDGKLTEEDVAGILEYAFREGSNSR